jgi:fumarate reductase subunit C
MSTVTRHTEHHPRWLRRRVSTYWWLERRAYLVFILRELSSVFVAWFVIFFLLLVHAVARGAAEYQQFLAWSAHPLLIFLNVVSLLFVVFHAITWINLAPQAVVVRLRGRRVPALWIAAPNYLAWLAVTVLAVWLLAGG